MEKKGLSYLLPKYIIRLIAELISVAGCGVKAADVNPAAMR
jgi:hypothetical protein